MLTNLLDESVGTDDLTRYGASEYVYGHHRDKSSFLVSMREGCAMCNRLSGPEFEGNNYKLQSLGYFSVFYVRINRDLPLQKNFAMYVEVGNCSRGSHFVPLGGETFVATTAINILGFPGKLQQLTVPG